MKKKPPKSAGDDAQKVRRIEMEPRFMEDLRFWIECDRKVALRIMELVNAVMRDPFGGIGKPEPLKYLRSNAWSRRITDEHRLVYLVETDRVVFKSGRFHYDK
ncbi:MAG: Txe/YoeB family addiction module toxin [Synechococcales bacterium]|nr:Txe/YoeB family addiction module toxin [Synechococcales bacterium]